MMRSITRPSPGEYPAYAAMYVDLVPDDGQVLAALEHAAVRRATLTLFDDLPEEALARSGIANGAEVLHHLAVLRERYGASS